MGGTQRVHFAKRIPLFDRCSVGLKKCQTGLRLFIFANAVPTASVPSSSPNWNADVDASALELTNNLLGVVNLSKAHEYSHKSERKMNSKKFNKQKEVSLRQLREENTSYRKSMRRLHLPCLYGRSHIVAAKVFCGLPSVHRYVLSFNMIQILKVSQFLSSNHCNLEDDPSAAIGDVDKGPFRRSILVFP